MQALIPACKSIDESVMLFGIRAACIVMLVLKKQTMDKLLNETESLRYLMDLISANNFSMPTISNYASKSLFIMRGINSSFKTLDGIKALVNTNDYIDCYLLIRRIRDCIMFDSFLAYDAKNNHHTFVEDIPLDLETEEGRTKFENWLTKRLEQSAEYDANDKRKKDIEDRTSSNMFPARQFFANGMI